MAKRVRLTDPRRASQGRRAVEDNIPYPGTVNQPERKFKRMDQYDNYEETVNHPIPDMRHEWKNDSRDDIGFGIPEPEGTNQMPTIASVRVAASKAVRAAVLLLGEKVSDEVIEAQARDFMALGDEGLDRTIERFVESQDLYVEAADDSEEDAAKSMQEKKEEEAKADKEASAALADKMDEVPEAIKAEDEEEEAGASEEDETKEASTDFEAAVEARVAELKAEAEAKDEESRKAAIEAEALKRIEAESKTSSDDEDEDDEGEEDDSKEASEKEASEEVVAEDKEEEDKEEDSKEASETVEASEEVVEAPVAEKRGMNELDIELTSASEMDTGEGEADPRLSSLFEDDDVTAAEEAQAPAPRKAGIKELGGQPRAMTAGQGGAADLGSIWDTAPDVSGVFR